MYESYTEDVLIKNIEILTHINAIVFWERRQIVSQVNATLYANMKEECVSSTLWNTVKCWRYFIHHDM